MLSNLLEKLYFKLWKSWPLFFFFTGLLYSLLGIVIGVSTKMPILAVFIIAIALIPTIDKFISLTELLEGKTKMIEAKNKGLYLIELRAKAQKISIKNLFSDYTDVILAYTFYFMTILFVFGVFAFFNENSSEILFSLKLVKAEINTETLNIFFELIKNNISVFSIAFLLSFVFEFGATFIVSWNAAVWGVSFGSILRQTFVSKNIATSLSLTLITPHLFLEALAYFFAAIAGALLSKVTIKEKIESEKFKRIAMQSLLLIGFGLLSLIIAAHIESLVIKAGIL